MLTADLMIGTMQAVFDVAEDGVEPLELGDFHAAEAATGDDGLVLEAGTGDGREAREPIGQHDGVGVEVTLGEAFDLRLPKPGDLAEAQSDRVALRVAGQGGDERHLVGRAAPRLGPVALATPIGVIDLDDTAKGCLIVMLFHHLQELVLDAPRGQRGDAQMTLELQRRDPVLLLRQQEHRQEPGREWQLGGLKDGSGRQRRFDGDSGDTARAPACANAPVCAGDRNSGR